MTQMAYLPRELVAEVGDSYLAAKDSRRDDLVIAAYEHLQAETDLLFRALVRGPDVDRVRVVFTGSHEPYSGDAELIAAVRDRRVLEITTVALSSEPIHPLLGCEYGGAFDRFHAVHDLIGHAAAGFGFDLGGELAAWQLQDRLHSPIARWALATELLGVNSARSILGQAPGHTAMLLDSELLRRSRSRLAPCRSSSLSPTDRRKVETDERYTDVAHTRAQINS